MRDRHCSVLRGFGFFGSLSYGMQRLIRLVMQRLIRLFSLPVYVALDSCL